MKDQIFLSREIFKYLFEESPDAIAILNDKDIILQINEKFTELFGYTSEETVGKKINNLIVPEEKKDEGAEATKKVAAGEKLYIETVRKNKSGERINVSILGSPVKLKNKKIIVYGIYRDITKRIKAKKELKDNKEKYKTLFEYTGTATCIFDENKVITMCNDKFVELAKLSRKKIVNKMKWSDFVSDKDLERMKKYHYLRNKNEKNPPNEYEFEFIDGEENKKYIHLQVTKIKNSSKRIASLIDITDLKEVEDNLRKSEKKYRLLYNSIRDAILIADTDRIITDCNQAFTKLFGYKKEEVVGKKTFYVYANEGEFEELGEKINENYGEDSFLQIQHYRKKNGEIFPGETAVYYLKNEQGEVTGFVGLISDISDRLELQQQLAHSQKMESIGRLAGGVAHDMNNLLMPILGYTKMLKRDETIENEHKDILEEIIKASNRAKDLVSQLLAFSRKQTLNKKVINVNKVLKNFKNLLRKVVREDIKISYNLNKDVKKVKVDRRQIEQVIMNIVLNSQDAMTKGGKITIETDNIELDESYISSYQDFKKGEYVKILISDTGKGIEKQNIAKIFEPFYTTKGEEGTGLGLSTAYGIIKQHKGDIHAYSEIGEGASFSVYLPVTAEERKVYEEEYDTEKQIDITGTETILIAEDNEQTIELLSKFLVNNGYNVITAENGDMALKKVKKIDGKIDMLISDVIMPGINGNKLYSEIKKLYPNIKVIFMSGYPDDIINQYGLQDEEINFIHKPFGVKKLGKIIRKIFD